MIDITDNKSIYPVKRVHYFPTEINAIDGLLNGGGIFPREFTFLCGRPGIGKTAVAAQIASNMAFCGINVMYVDLELSKITLAYLASEAKEDESIDEHLEIHYDVPGRLGSVAKAIKESKAEVVIIDYIQLLDLETAKDWTDVVSTLPRDRAYLIISQISRDADERDCHFPELEDLTGKLPFEFIPHATIMLYRDSYYEGVEPSVMEVFVYRGEEIRGHGHWEWTPKQFITPYYENLSEEEEKS